MKRLAPLLAVAAAVIVLSGAAAARAETPPTKIVSVTDAGVAVDLGVPVASLCLKNGGSNEVFYSLDGAPATTAGTNEIAPGELVCWSDLRFATLSGGASTPIVYLDTSTGETTSVTLYGSQR